MGAALPDPGAGSLTLPAELLQHRAVLTLPDGTPFSEVVETYTARCLPSRSRRRPPAPWVGRKNRLHFRIGRPTI